jgi:hypothetical protein
VCREKESTSVVTFGRITALLASGTLRAPILPWAQSSAGRPITRQRGTGLGADALSQSCCERVFVAVKSSPQERRGQFPARTLTGQGVMVSCAAGDHESRCESDGVYLNVIEWIPVAVKAVVLSDAVPLLKVAVPSEVEPS